MEMFLMAAALSVLGVAVSALLFAAATRDERRADAERAAERLPGPPPRFFADSPGLVAPPVPREALLLLIERHVRLEQAAAESFLYAPTAESLHSRTASPLVH
jgi:hypothetical protein